MCLKTSNPEFFKFIFQKDYLKNFIFISNKNSEIKKKFEEFFQDWVKLGIRIPQVESNQNFSQDFQPKQEKRQTNQP